MPDADSNMARNGRPETRVDFVVYVIAALSLIGLGVAFQGWILNWIAGPAFVIVFIIFATPVAHRIARRRTQGQAERQAGR